jgi:CDP-diacylglycerol--glycerol-3-phosphate 3-phosphatidyltransferase
LFDGRFRTAVDRAVRPAGAALRRTGLSPDHLTAIGIAMALPAGWAIATGHLVLGVALLVASAVPDLLDGALAKASGRASIRGAFFDSVGDRISDSIILGAIAWYLQDRYHGHAAILPLAILGASQLISYERAKAESLGFQAKGGLMERAERIITLCVGLAFSVLLVPLLWLMLVLTLVTAVQRFVKVWRQASKPPKPEPAAVTLRWRAWRESNGWAPRSARERDDRMAGFRRTQAGARWHERRVARQSLRAERDRRAGGRRGPGTSRP